VEKVGKVQVVVDEEQNIGSEYPYLSIFFYKYQGLEVLSWTYVLPEACMYMHHEILHS
jgi:hypothetical protein